MMLDFVRNLTDHTSPCLSGNTSRALPSGQDPQEAEGSMTPPPGSIFVFLEVRASTHIFSRKDLIISHTGH